MRSLTIAGLVSFALVLVGSRPATCQEASRGVSVTAEVVSVDSTGVRSGEVAAPGPRLPAVVPAVPLPLEPAPAAPKGNIVIPVTTALIVLAALVLILLID